MKFIDNTCPYCGAKLKIDLKAMQAVCEHCGAPLVEVVTARGPWRICVNMDCPGKEKDKEAASSRGKGRARGRSTTRRSGSSGTRTKKK